MGLGMRFETPLRRNGCSLGKKQKTNGERKYAKLPLELIRIPIHNLGEEDRIAQFPVDPSHIAAE